LSRVTRDSATFHLATIRQKVGLQKLHRRIRHSARIAYTRAMSGGGDAHYRIGRRLGRGAVAEVFEITDAAGARFAGKFLHASREGDVAAELRSQQEAQLLEGLEHPHIVQVFGRVAATDVDGNIRHCLRLEIVDGADLAQRIAKDAPMSESSVIEYAAQIASGLAAAHGRGIVHLDLKPANVLVSSTEPTVLKIGDFGMARASSLSGVEVGGRAVLGTPDYMAPESIEPIAVDARTDLYALGCMIFEMLTGNVPFAAATPLGILQQHRDAPIPVLPDVISSGMRTLVTELMAKSPADRPPSAASVLDRLTAIARSDGRLSVLARATSGPSCAQCGEPLVRSLSMCLYCGIFTPGLEPGAYRVIVTGPGEIGALLDGFRRETLHDWIKANPTLGLRIEKRLSHRIPRLPFVLVAGVSEKSADSLVEALVKLGLRSEAKSGAVLRHPGIRKKIWKLSGRVALVALPVIILSMRIEGSEPFFGVALLGLMVASAVNICRAVTKRLKPSAPDLSPVLQAALDDLGQRAVGLEQRHRLQLRAIVRRALKVRHQTGNGQQYDGILADLLTRATASAVALHRIETQLQPNDLNQTDDATRKILHQRDQLAVRLLELDGTLEQLQLKVASAKQPYDDGHALTELRLKIEALEEVQKR
jgi:Protein kinase domain